MKNDDVPPKSVDNIFHLDTGVPKFEYMMDVFSEKR